jgi:hypothetical protein
MTERNTFLKRIMELGANEDRASSKTERKMAIEQAKEIYNEHFKIKTMTEERIDHMVLLHSERMRTANEQAEYNKFAMLKPKLQRDGDQWCVLFGRNLQEGIAGFGSTPHEAIMDWNSQWHRPCKNEEA